MTWFERFDQHKGRNIFLLAASYLFINNSINATSVWMEATRNGETPEFNLIEPFVWEYSSAIAVLLLLPLLQIFWQRVPLQPTHVKRQLFAHFSDTLREFSYEYRKSVTREVKPRASNGRAF